jgi:hypothetical protein
MTLINQEDVYNSCGTKIKTDLLQGNAVVLFAYGLSGSGKTFTVFGVRIGSVVCCASPTRNELCLCI